MGKTLILGIGNTIRGDDAAGIMAARALGARIGPDDITVEETQESGVRLLSIIAGYERVVIIDSISTCDGVPGDIYRFGLSKDAGNNYVWRNEGRRGAGRAVMMAQPDFSTEFGESSPVTAYSSHQAGLRALIKAGDNLIEIPGKIIIYAIEIEKKELFYCGLSQRVKDAVSLAADLIGEELHLLTV